MIRTLVRVLTGFALACLTAGLLQLLFAKPPAKIAATGDAGQVVMEMIEYALLFATHSAIFSAAFALIAAGVGEWTATRSIAYYLFAGAVIALLGFSAQYASEAPGQPTVFNNYALKAYLTSGFFAGLVYWLTAGRGAGGRSASHETGAENEAGTIGVPPPSKSWKSRPRLIVEDAPRPGTKAAKKASLAERLADEAGPSVNIAKADTAAEPKPDVKNPANSSQPIDVKAAAKAAASVAQAPVTSVPSTRTASTTASPDPASAAPGENPKKT